MSQYPYRYGQWPPPPVPPSQEYLPSQEYAPDNPDPGNAFGNIISTNQEAFAYNVSQIPGLGIAGSPAPGAHHGWSHMAPAPAPPAGAHQYHIPPQHLGGFYQPDPRHYAPPPPENYYFPPPPENLSRAFPAQLSLPRDQDNGMEEGELSEDDLENLYEPAEHVESTKIGTTSAGNSVLQPATPTSRGVSIIDVQDDAFYEDEPGEINSDEVDPTPAYRADEVASQSSRQHKGPTTRARSGSYSPYLSPREIHLEDQASEEPKLDTATGGDSASMADISDQARFDATLAPLNGVNSIAEGFPEPSIRQPPDAVNSAAYPLPGRTIEEAKKGAQKAILRLVSMGANYQTYIDEGINPKVMASLFNDLGLNAASDPPQNKGPATSPDRIENLQLQPSQLQPSESSSVAMEKQEERKDRIARLLAAKAAKSGSTPAAPLAPSAPSAPSAASTPSVSVAPSELHPPREKTKFEKELLLQRKMEALQKSRNDRAVRTEKISTYNGTEFHPAEKDQPTSSVAGEQHLSHSSGVVQRGLWATPAPASGRGTPSISELAQPPLSQAAHPLASVRKRPVATDFDDYSSAVGSIKRPFGLNRQNSSLVIDVSDGSDDEDVEMEMESPLDGFSLNRALESPPRRGLSIRDFPPLTDISQRNYASSASSVPTPPNGAGKDDKYSKKMKEIEEMKRRIAEAEARKASKTPVGMRTPNKALDPREKEGFALPPVRRASAGDAGNGNSPSGQEVADVVSVTLPKPSELRGTPSTSKQQRRTRISSLQLPKVEDTLQRKVSEMQLMREKISQLQREIDDAMSAKQQLTEELDELSDDSTSSSPQPSMPQPPTAELDDSSDLENGSNGASSEKDSPSRHGTSDSSEGSQPKSGSVLSESDDALGEDVNEAIPASLDVVDMTVNDARTPAAPMTEPPTDDKPDSPDRATPVDADEAAPEPIHPDTPSNGSDSVEEGEIGSQEAAEVLVTSDTGSPTVDSVADIASDDDIDMHSPDAALGEVQAQMSDPTLDDTTLGKVEQTREASISAVPDTTFTPYVSPLQYFRSYRFHPAFQDSVPGGLRSLTYSSSKIDPTVEICPSELEGQECPNGPSCQYQHFASMTASENDLLVELSNSSDLRGEENTRFLQGLRGVLQNARIDNVRDFDTIAHSIIKYRRQFLGDESRVLTHLGGTSI